MENVPKAIQHSENMAVQKLTTKIGHLKSAVMTGEASLSLVPDANIESYRALCQSLYMADAAKEKVTTMVNFLAGDALAQGEQIYGEEQSCIYGVNVMWDKRYCDTVVRTSRAIPPELRSIRHSWRFYVMLGGSELSDDEIERYMKIADSYKERMMPNWSAITYDNLNDDKVLALLEGVDDDEESDAIQEWYKAERPNWRKVQKRIEEGKITAASPKPTMTEAIIKIVDNHVDIPNNPVIRDAVVDAMWALVDEIKADNIDMKE